MGPRRPTIFFLAKNYQRLVQIGLARRRLVQDGASWCRVVQVGVA